MSGSYVVILIGCLYMVWCAFVAVLTFLRKNEAVFHLNDLYVLGFAAAYAICAPFGLAGILGAINRNKSLIRGFLFQYWMGALFLIGISVVSTILAYRWRTETIVNCISLGTPGNAVATRNKCIVRVNNAQLISLIYTSVQGGIMVLLGIILLIFGMREFRDISIDEETSNLLEKSTFAARGSLDQDVSEPQKIYRAPSNASSTESNPISRRPTNASSNSNPLSRRPTNASSNSNPLSRRPTNASSNPYRGGMNRQPTLPHHQMPPARGLSRHPTDASNSSSVYSSAYSSSNAQVVPPINTTYLGRAPLLVPEHAYHTRTRPLADISEVPPNHQFEYNNSDRSICSPPQAPALINGARPPTPPFYEPYYNEDDYTNYWQPAVAKSMASNLTRNGLY